MTESVETVNLTAEDATRLFGDLEELTVNLDRILSRIGAGSDPGILLNYVVERNIRSRIAWARGMVGDALEAAIGADAVETLAGDVFRYTDHQ